MAGCAPVICDGGGVLVDTERISHGVLAAMRGHAGLRPPFAQRMHGAEDARQALPLPAAGR